MSNASSPEGLETWLAETRDWAEAALESALAELGMVPDLLMETMRYSLFGGGKRLRPALVRMSCLHCGGSDEQAAPAAAALEMIHTYSLIHDDLPAMDDDDLRRGRPTCHKAFDEAQAVLAGDGLQAAAFATLAQIGGARGAQMVAVLARSAGPAGMVGGQVLDLEHTGDARHAAPDAGAVRRIHALKTAALIAAATEVGAIAAGANAEARERMRAYGERLGLCFQAVDDLLDVTGDAASLGKTPGKDAAEDKATLVALLGLEGARLEAQEHAAEARRLAAEVGGAQPDLLIDLVSAVLERSH